MGQNNHFMLLVLVFAIIFGSYVAFGNLIGSLFIPFGYTTKLISVCGLNLLVAGVLGSIVFSKFVDITGKYKATVLLLATLFTASMGVTRLYLGETDTTFMVYMVCIIGFFGVPFIPLCLAFAIELTFPMQPALINGSMMLIG